jgi:hypothetical protein
MEVVTGAGETSYVHHCRRVYDRPVRRLGTLPLGIELGAVGSQIDEGASSLTGPRSRPPAPSADLPLQGGITTQPSVRMQRANASGLKLELIDGGRVYSASPLASTVAPSCRSRETVRRLSGLHRIIDLTVRCKMRVTGRSNKTCTKEAAATAVHSSNAA